LTAERGKGFILNANQSQEFLSEIQRTDATLRISIPVADFYLYNFSEILIPSDR